MIPKLLVPVTITYLAFTIVFRSAYPQDHYYYLIGEPINTDSLIFIKSFTVTEFDALGGETYNPGSKRKQDSWLDTNCSYYLVANCINNLYQPFYVISVSVIDRDTKVEYDVRLAVSAKAWSGQTFEESIIKGRSAFQLHIGSSLSAYNDPIQIKTDSLLKIAFDTRNIDFIITTSNGRIMLRPQQYRSVNGDRANS
ncbi:MAG: hypothetical protein HUU02_10640 [Bacteroidetes bacterium]|nr:hypothetical protein [Bacteroidota bacterium]